MCYTLFSPESKDWKTKESERETLTYSFHTVLQEIRIWGEKYLGEDNLYRVVGDKLLSLISEGEFLSEFTSISCEQDNETLSDIQEKLEAANLKPEQQFTDKGYVTGDNLADSQEKGIQLMGEASQLDNKGLFTADDFTVDYENKSATCPAGCISISWKKRKSGKHKDDIQIRFGNQCNQCPLKEQCATSKRGRRLRLNLHYPILRKRRAESKTHSFRELMKRRPPVEGTISEMVRAYGLRRSRYRGIMKTHFHSLMVGTAVNLKRLVKAISLSKNDQKQQLAAA